MPLEIGEPLPPRPFNWPSFCDELWRVALARLRGVPPELNSLVALGSAKDPDPFRFSLEQVASAVFELWDEDPGLAIRDGLEVWLEGLQYHLATFCTFEVESPDVDRIRRRIKKIRLDLDDASIDTLIRAAEKPADELGEGG